MLIPPSSSSGYVVFHATSCIPRIPQKNYIGRVPPKFSPPISRLSASVAGTAGLLRARRSFAARRGAANNVSHEFREATRIGVEPLHIGRRFPTLRQYGQVPPVILRLFAPRRIAALYVGTYTYAAVKPPWRNIAIEPGWGAKSGREVFRSLRSIFALISLRQTGLSIAIFRDCC